MTQHDRGAYTPQTDAPLAFDARAPRGGRRPLPMALIASAVVLLVMIAAVVMYYRSGVRSGPDTPTVGQPVTAVRSPAPAEAQPADPAADLDVYASQNVPTTPTEPAFVAPPEQPAPRPAPQPGLKVQTIDPSPVNPVPAAGVPPRAVATAPAPPQPAVKAPAAAPAPAPAPAAVAAAPAAGGAAMVQIGAYSSTALADRGYSEVAAAFPGPMAGKSKRVETLARDGKTLYRGLIGGFASRSAAQAFCDTLKASGRTCLVRG